MNTRTLAPLGRPDPGGVEVPTDDPGERGRLQVDLGVVRKVAQHAADLVPGILPAPRRVAGVGLGTSGTSAKVSARGETVDVQLDVALRYPGPVRATVAELRRVVAAEVARITGYRVGAVAVAVSALLPEPSRRLV